MEDLYKILNKIYDKSAYTNKYRLTEEDLVKFKHKDLATYGEVTYNSTEGIVNRFKDHFTKDAIFYDLGCGFGKMVIHIAMKYGIESYGVELATRRIEAARQLKEEYCKDLNNIHFLEEDFNKTDLSKASIVYFDNTVYSYDTLDSIWDKLNKDTLLIHRKSSRLGTGLRECTSIEYSDNFLTTYNNSRLLYAIKK